MTSRRLLLTALALDFDQDRKVGRGGTIPCIEGCKELQTVTLRIDGNGDPGAVSRGGLEGVLTRVIALGWQFFTGGVGEFEWFAVRAGERVGKRVECEVTSESKSGYDIWRSDEGVRGWVSIITAGKVTVV